MSTSTPLAFVLVPGGYCLPTQFERVTERLNALEHTVQPIHLPSVGRAFSERNGRPATYYDDADHVNSVIASLADSGHNVIAAGSSYGGWVITEAAKGLSKAERDGSGKNGSGALVGLVYLASMLSEVGFNLAQLLEGKVMVPVSDKFDVDFLDPPPAEVAGPVLCSELEDKEEQIRYAKMMDIFSTRVYADKLRHAGWKVVPTTVVVAARDKTLDPSLAHESFERAVKVLETEGKPITVKKVVLEADHLCMISQPDKVVEILLDATRSG